MLEYFMHSYNIIYIFFNNTLIQLFFQQKLSHTVIRSRKITVHMISPSQQER